MMCVCLCENVKQDHCEYVQVDYMSPVALSVTRNLLKNNIYVGILFMLANKMCMSVFYGFRMKCGYTIDINTHLRCHRRHQHHHHCRFSAQMALRVHLTKKTIVAVRCHWILFILRKNNFQRKMLRLLSRCVFPANIIFHICFICFSCLTVDDVLRSEDIVYFLAHRFLILSG